MPTYLFLPFFPSFMKTISLTVGSNFMEIATTSPFKFLWKVKFRSSALLLYVSILYAMNIKNFIMVMLQ